MAKKDMLESAFKEAIEKKKKVISDGKKDEDDV
jgi:vacuolar-type H+-ATPase subunit H